MYLERLWPELEQALADAEQGDGNGLLALHDAYFERREDGSYPNYLEAFQTISCMDRVDRPDRRRRGRRCGCGAARRHLACRPATPARTSARSSRLPSSPRIEVTGAGAAPILVVGTTGDPATPLVSTQAMADALDGAVLLTVVADQHTGYGVNDCSIEVVDRVLGRTGAARRGHRAASDPERTNGRPYGAAVGSNGGGRSGIRTHGGPEDLNSFRDCPIRPLWHPSGAAG